MHRVKGLEFTYMYLVCINNDVMPLKNAIRASDPVAKKEAILAERCLLYVALTRTKKEVYISSYGKQSALLPENHNSCIQP